MNKLPYAFDYWGLFVVRHPMYEAGLGYAVYGYDNRPFFVYSDGKWVTVSHSYVMPEKPGIPPLTAYLEFDSLEALIEYETANSEVQFRVVYHE